MRDTKYHDTSARCNRKLSEWGLTEVPEMTGLLNDKK